MKGSLRLTLRTLRVCAVLAEPLTPQVVQTRCVVWVFLHELDQAVARLGCASTLRLVAVYGGHMPLRTLNGKLILDTGVSALDLIRYQTEGVLDSIELT